jgi:hypothetical protein
MYLKKDILFVSRLIFSPYYFLIILLSFIKIKFFNGNISEKEYQAMINLFLISNGRSNDLFHKFLKKKINIENNQNLNNDNVKSVVSDLNEKGYYVKENYISSNDCLSILNQSYEIEGYYKLDNNPDISNYKKRFDRQSPKGTMFSYDESALLNIKEIQDIISNPFLTNIATDYFEGLPILSAVNMWWSTKFKDTPDSECAQKFHFDMDSLKWLKFFIYITDVKKKNGPHTFVTGSHKVNSFPYQIRKAGYSRIDDYVVINKFGASNLIEFDKPAGTLIVEDTKGLHKGKNVEEGDRLLLTIEFTSTKFIKNTNRKILNKSISNKFLNFYKKNNYLMQFYEIN